MKKWKLLLCSLLLFTVLEINDYSVNCLQLGKDYMDALHLEEPNDIMLPKE